MAHRDFMNKAIELAKKAREIGEVPVGAVIVKDNRIVGEGYNMRENGQNALAHAEVIAINQACENLGSWRLEDCTMYVTLEPCPMCAGAIINSRIKTVVYSCIDFKGGAMGGKTDLTACGFNHQPEIICGVCENESRQLLDDFFKKLRK